MKKNRLFICLFIMGWLISNPVAIIGQVTESEESIFTDLKAALEYKGQVKHLNLSNQKLKKIPKEVFEFPNLKTLDLSNNKITVLPSQLGLLTRLEEIYLTKNKIDELPKEIGNLKRLRILKMRNNLLYTISKEIGQLGKLEIVDFNGNPLWRLPEEFRSCTNLKYLDIRNTDIDKGEIGYIKTMFPGVEIFFTDGCNCGPGN
jgi:Leucine-rich repeat (LRR) protein